MENYVDRVDGTRYPLGVPRWRSDAGRPLWIEPGPGIRANDIDGSTKSLWRYRKSFPLTIDRPITLGEGCTPLINSTSSGAPVLYKLDFLNPTGSFKDRGTSVMLSYLRQHGITAVLEDSSGNGGSSVADYAAAGGLDVKIFAPASTSAGKVLQVRAYGAEVELVPDPREESQNEAIRQEGPAFYSSHNWQPFFLQGTKTLAYELWEDLGFEVPDNVIVPVGAGSSLLGCWLGFTELRNAGAIEKLPRLFAAQPLNCSPVDAAFISGGEERRRIEPTIAEGTAIAEPLHLLEILDALKDTAGGTVAVPEEDIAAALADLCSQGLFVEPTSATAAAAFSALLNTGTIAKGEKTVVLLTGSGMKAAQKVHDLIESEPPRS